MHLDGLSDKYQAQFNVAESGKRFWILKGYTDYNTTRTIEFLLEYFPKMPPLWISNLLGDQDLFHYNSGDIIIREGSRSQGTVFMILTGYALVVQHLEGKKTVVAQVEAGEIIGEMAVLSGDRMRNASVVAFSPVTVTAFSDKAFLDFIQHQHLEGHLKNTWENRSNLQKFSKLNNLPQKVLRSLAESVQFIRTDDEPGPNSLSQLAKNGCMIFPLNKDIEISENNNRVKYKKLNDFLYIHKSVRVKGDRGTEILLLNMDDAVELCKNIPVFRFFWEEELDFPSLYPF
jgi:hypothetical protein